MMKQMILLQMHFTTKYFKFNQRSKKYTGTFCKWSSRPHDISFDNIILKNTNEYVNVCETAELQLSDAQ